MDVHLSVDPHEVLQYKVVFPVTVDGGQVTPSPQTERSSGRPANYGGCHYVVAVVAKQDRILSTGARLHWGFK